MPKTDDGEICCIVPLHRELSIIETSKNKHRKIYRKFPRIDFRDGITESVRI